MTGASEDLLQAVYGLRKAAEAQFTGNAYYQVASEISVLIEHLGENDGSVPVGQNAAYGFATALDEVRGLAKVHTSGSQYSVILKDLDQIAAFLTPAAEAPAKPAPASEKPASAEPAAAPTPAPSSKPVTPVELLQAIFGLRRAAQEQFPGSAYLEVGKDIDGLIEAVGGDKDSVPPGKDAAYGFATMLDEVRRIAELRTAGNQYYSIVVKLDRLTSFLTPSTAASEAEELERRSSEPCSMAELAPVAAEPVAAAAPLPADHAQQMAAGDAAKCPFHAVFADTAQAPAAPAAQDVFAPVARDKIESFDELAAASKARVEQVAASLGVAAAHAAPASPAVAAEAPSERRLESRSSEAVSPSLGSIEPTAITAEAAPEPVAAETAAHLGSQAAQSEAFAIEEAVVIEETVVEEIAVVEAPAAEIAVQPAVAVSEAVPQSLASAPEPIAAEEVAVLEVAAAEIAAGPAVAVAAPAAAPASVQRIEVLKPAETKRKEPKTLFRLWLDLAFGRKD